MGNVYSHEDIRNTYEPIRDHIRTKHIIVQYHWCDLVDFLATPHLAGLIPSAIDQNPCAHWRNPMEMIRQG